jgi:peptide/nickel transport system substrate-binding protein
MYLIDRVQMAPVVEGQGGRPHRYAIGFGDHLVPQWLDRATLARLNTYPYNPQKGIGLLRRIGWTRGADGIWTTPDGQKATWEILAEAEFPDVLACGQNFADQLAPHGFKLSVRKVTYSQTPILRAQGKFELTATVWGAAAPHPYASWEQDLAVAMPPDPRSIGPGAGFQPIQHTSGFGTVDLRTLIDQSRQGLNIPRQRALVRKMALVYNEVLPFFPLVERYGRNPTRPGVRVAGWPPLRDPIYLNGPYTDSFVVMMLLTGQLHAA